MTTYHTHLPIGAFDLTPAEKTLGAAISAAWDAYFIVQDAANAAWAIAQAYAAANVVSDAACVAYLAAINARTALDAAEDAREIAIDAARAAYEDD